MNPLLLTFLAVQPIEVNNVPDQAPPSEPVSPDVATDWTNVRLNTDATTQIQNEEQLCVNPANPDNIVGVWRDFRLGYREIGVGWSTDGGTTWTDALLAGAPQDLPWSWNSDPGLTYDDAGNFYAVVLSFEQGYGNNGLYVLTSTDGGANWGSALTAVEDTTGAYFHDKELIACDRTATGTNGNLYVSWTRFGSDYPIFIVRSTDGGATWSNQTKVSDWNWCQWSVPAVGSDGTVYVAWGDYLTNTLYLDRSTDGGLTFGTDIPLVTVQSIDEDINGGIRAFSFPALETDISGGTYDGNLYVGFRDTRSGYADDDIWFIRSSNGGSSWSSPLRINDDAPSNGRDQFHPWLVVDESGVIWAAWLDRRNDPANLKYDCYLTSSSDGGATWAANRRVSEVSSVPFSAVTAGLLGEYIGLGAYGGKSYPLWTDTRDGSQDAWVGVPNDTTSVGEGGPVAEMTEPLRLWPQPAGERLNVAFFSWSEGTVEAKLYSASGRLSGSYTLRADEGENVFNLSPGLPAGTYVLRLTTPDGATLTSPFAVR